MTPQISYRQAAIDDIDAITQHLEQIDRRLADRFEDAVQETARLALAYPALGRTVDFQDSALHGSRFLIPRGFRNYLLFYFPTAQGIDVLRVLHGARDIEHLG
jgi:toxin ParE1/3/4